MATMYGFLCSAFGWLARLTDCTKFLSLNGEDVISTNIFVIMLKTVIISPFLCIVMIYPCWWIMKIGFWGIGQIANGFLGVPFEPGVDSSNSSDSLKQRTEKFIKSIFRLH